VINTPGGDSAAGRLLFFGLLVDVVFFRLLVDVVFFRLLVDVLVFGLLVDLLFARPLADLSSACRTARDRAMAAAPPCCAVVRPALAA
jgi:hypothetical protein